jgi:protein SCO1/2
MRWIAALVMVFAPAAGTLPVRGQPALPQQLRGVGIDQRLGEQVPLDLSFRDETGQPVQLAQYFGRRPVILVLAYYRCPMLCTQVLNGLVHALWDVPLDMGDDYEVVTVSFDPRETPELAAAKKKSYLMRYHKAGGEQGWHFLTGGEPAIKRLTKAVGFHYSYDARNDQFAHASGIMVLTPRGKVSRYFYGINFSARDLRLGLVEASENRIGSPVDKFLLFCFHYDPTTGRYGVAVMNLVRLGGILTVLVLGTFIFVNWWRERRKKLVGPASRAGLEAEVPLGKRDLPFSVDSSSRAGLEKGAE